MSFLLFVLVLTAGYFLARAARTPLRAVLLSGAGGLGGLVLVSLGFGLSGGLLLVCSVLWFLFGMVGLLIGDTWQEQRA
jgi:hypothetical protein